MNSTFSTSAIESQALLWCDILCSPLSPSEISGLVKQNKSLEDIHQQAKKGLGSAEVQSLIAQHKNWLEQADHHLISIYDHRYPTLLKETSQPPLAIWATGNIALLADPQMAIVGSRNPTAGGYDTGYAFASALAKHGLIITSGMAIGIDSAAHLGALDQGAATIAVLGTGVDQVYPRQQKEMASRIAKQGLLISEYLLGSAARRSHFPQRNRIIAGLSVGTLVVEAALRSGSLITARCATEAGREVFAIPSSIHNPMSRGCHRLIQQGAKLTESINDILLELTDTLSLSILNQKDELPNVDVEELDGDYVKLIEAMGFDPVSIEQLTKRSRLTAAEISSMLVILELQGRVSSLDGGKYQIKPLENRQ